jgi:class 3 adenylate cyclase
MMTPPSSAPAATILIVDDTPANLGVLFDLLSTAGFEVLVATDGPSAVQRAAYVKPGLILLDVVMPGMDGFATCAALKAQPETREIPVIFMTAMTETAQKVQGLQLGAVDYITKPFQSEEVLARVQTQLSLQRAMEEVRHLATQLERHNQFIRQTFGRYVTDDVVASLLDSPEGLRLGGEKRLVTIVMADLRGFTAFSGRLAPEQVVAILNIYLGKMAEVITQYQGTIDEFIGDTILVLFGAPIWRQDHAARAVACAVAMQLAMDAVNAELCQAGLPAVEMGIGVNTGEVVVGNIGSHKRAKYGVVGSPVNLTSRIESYAVGGQVLISEATRQAIGPLLRIAKHLEVNAKGLDTPVAVYDVRGIGGTYNLLLPEPADALVPLEKALRLRYTVLEDKHLGEAVYTGSLLTLSARGGELLCNQAVALWSDLKIQLLDNNEEAFVGAFYAKVVRRLPEGLAGFYVHFTYLPPEVVTFF